MPVKVKIEPRDSCISDMVCVSICGEVFQINDDDGKSEIVPQFRVSPDNNAEGEVPDDLKDCVQEAADSCPVNIIIVEEA
ncbi:MAG: ferredoxin [Desulfurococcales archaeon]|nr:ferredoxin [Desulfurococcales archaeon]MEB3760558.1 ferredoxin [Desulfurococcales archaeon]MEB3765966.1 ferredoxin [Desulfurococcales archaeon]MEB3788440.1 ferredoxin [Desulfurococcales archaeon]